jgi:hypothetical protein
MTGNEKSSRMNIYDKVWKSHTPCQSSWATRGLDDEHDKFLDLYLLKINDWFKKYSENSADLLTRLESHENKVHRAAVNELFWYNLALNFKWEIKPIPPKNKKGENRPDFEVISPVSFNCEITTLNEPDPYKAFSLEKDIIRLYGKSFDESKQAQIEWSLKGKKPHLLVIFDYSKLSGIGTHHQKSLPDFFQKPVTGSQRSSIKLPPLPEGLSSILYLERYVAKGKFMLRMEKSVLIHNPNATFPLGNEMFDWLNQKKDLEII